MNPIWKDFIDLELNKDYGIKLKNFIIERRQKTNVLPSPPDVFNCFKLCDFHFMKVVIISGEPYTNRNDAHGLAFSSLSKTTPTALKNILDEVYADYYNGSTGGVVPFKHNNLTQWATQGVLLVNSIFTVDEGKSGSHLNKGWETFTENMVKMINEKHPAKLVFCLWGAQAKKYKQHITNPNHLILESEHPASAIHNNNSWFGNKNFSQANNFIKKNYFNVKAPINFGLW